MSPSATLRPASASSRAMPRPIPWPAPVISATFRPDGSLATHDPPSALSSRFRTRRVPKPGETCSNPAGPDDEATRPRRQESGRRRGRLPAHRTGHRGPMTVLLVGTLDTKGNELAFVRDLI